MKTPASREPASALIGALLLGLITTPWGYVALGALGAFPAPFAAVATPLLAVTTLNLGIEAFSARHRFRALRLAAAILSAMVLVTLLWGLSGFTLLTTTERAGLFATIWLAATALWLLLSLPFKATGPERLLRRRLNSPIRRNLGLASTAMLIFALAALAYHHLTTPEAFIG